MKPLRQPFVTASFWIAFAFWVAAICVLSSIPGPELAPAYRYIPGDKFAHFTAFAVGAGVLAIAIQRSLVVTRARVFLFALTAVAIFAAFDEWHQTFTKLRSGADVGDWTADVLGAAAGAGLALYFYGKNRRHLAH